MVGNLINTVEDISLATVTTKAITNPHLFENDIEFVSELTKDAVIGIKLAHLNGNVAIKNINLTYTHLGEEYSIKTNNSADPSNNLGTPQPNPRIPTEYTFTHVKGRDNILTSV